MRLHSTITSPYARKVWVFAHETGLIGNIQQIPTNPHVDEYLRDDNPLCRVPTLVLDAGEALFDSPVICEYLDNLHSGRRLISTEGPRDGVLSVFKPWAMVCSMPMCHGAWR